MKKPLALVLVLFLVTACSDGSDKRPALYPWLNEPLIETLFGPVQGVAGTNNTWAWKGIPFAAPPVEQLRWKAPRDPEQWSEPFAGDSFGNECMQFSSAGAGLIGDENCLTLNVWRPQTDEQKLPVYVWIHGGGNTAGSSSEPSYEGANLAATSNVVFVSMNYRLGPFGWFYNEALVDGDAESDSGNFGTLDIIKSLEWIRDNIERFGGDPDNVFITGESAGGINVLSLLVSPRASGLFHKAMSQSGLLAEVSLDTAAEFSTGLLPAVLVGEGLAADTDAAEAQLANMSSEEVRDVLLAAAPSSLMNPVPSIGVGLLSMPILFADGHVVVENGADSFTDGSYPNKVPLILGTNSGDVRLFLFALDNALSADVEMYNTVADIGGMLWKAGGADDIARAIADNPEQPDVYVYSFEWGRYATDGSAVTAAPFNYLIGAGHSVDIPFFLDTLEAPSQLTGLLFSEDNLASRELLSAQMIRYMQNFMRNGDPNSDDLMQQWYPWSNAEGSPKAIILDAGLTDLRLGTDYEGVSKQAAQDAIDAIPDPGLRQRVMDYLLDFAITCTLLSSNPGEECGA